MEGDFGNQAQKNYKPLFDIGQRAASAFCTYTEALENALRR